MDGPSLSQFDCVDDKCAHLRRRACGGAFRSIPALTSTEYGLPFPHGSYLNGLPSRWVHVKMPLSLRQLFYGTLACFKRRGSALDRLKLDERSSCTKMTKMTRSHVPHVRVLGVRLTVRQVGAARPNLNEKRRRLSLLGTRRLPRRRRELRTNERGFSR